VRGPLVAREQCAETETPRPLERNIRCENVPAVGPGDGARVGTSVAVGACSRKQLVWMVVWAVQSGSGRSILL